MNGHRKVGLGALAAVATCALAGSLLTLAPPISAATSTVSPAAAPAVNAAQLAQCTGTSPIVCHYDMAPGNYDVTIVLGSQTKAGVTDVSAEQRRVMLPTVTTAAGALQTFSFTVNVRNPEGEPTGQGGVGTTGLTITFGGTNPQLSGIGVVPAVAPKVLYVAGDSTACDQPSYPFVGWGQVLPKDFGLGLSVANYADSGESSGSFLGNSVLFPAMKKLMKTGDVVIISFGHNDKQVTAAAYSANLTSMVTQTRSTGATPVLVTPIPRHSLSGGKLTSTGLLVNGLGVDLPATMRAVAKANNVPLIDLNAEGGALVESLGNASSSLYLTVALDGISDNTHTSIRGATAFSDIIAKDIKAQNIIPASLMR